MFNIILFGPPGAGKGTLAKIMEKENRLVHLSTGNMLREEITHGTPVGMEADRLISKGFLVPDKMIVAMVREEVARKMPCAGFIFDGFPRTVKQAEQLDIIMSEHKTKIAMMISLEVAEDEIIRRIQHRAAIEGRRDDANISIIRNRIATYHKKTEATSDYYKAQGKFYAVNGNKNPEHTMNQIVDLFDNLKNKNR